VGEEIEIPSEFTLAKIGELLEKFPDYIPVYDYKKKAFIMCQIRTDNGCGGRGTHEKEK